MRKETECYKILKYIYLKRSMDWKSPLKLDLQSGKDQNKARRAGANSMSKWVEEQRVTGRVSRKMHLCASVHVYIWKTEASRWGITWRSRRNKTETGRSDVCRREEKRECFEFITAMMEGGKRGGGGGGRRGLSYDLIAKALWNVSCSCVNFFRFGQIAPFIVKTREVKTHFLRMKECWWRRHCCKERRAWSTDSPTADSTSFT